MIYKFCAKTDTGRARDNNEDSIAVDDETHLAVLADGMGGYNAGEVASGMATTLIAGELGHRLAASTAAKLADDIGRVLATSVDNANQAIAWLAAGFAAYVLAGLVGDRL